MMYVFNKMRLMKNDIVIWNSESRGSFHERLSKKYGKNYFSSEYFGDEIPSGALIHGIRHENMCKTSFKSNFFDFIFSSDDFEHVPEPQMALNEISRLLKKNGKFIFTAPFHIDAMHNEMLAKKYSDGRIIHFKEPQFHGDPLRPAEGILVYTIFGWELLRMCSEAGMTCKVINLYMPLCGILGFNAIVFVCQKGRG